MAPGVDPRAWQPRHEQPGSVPLQLPQPQVRLRVNARVFAQLSYRDTYKRGKQDIETLTLLHAQEAFMEPQR